AEMDSLPAGVCSAACGCVIVGGFRVNTQETPPVPRRSAACLLFTIALGFYSVGCRRASEAAEPAIHPDESRLQLSWKDARKAVGKQAFISGKVIRVGNAGRVNFLNFESRQPHRFTGIVFGEELDKFPKPLKEMYEGKIVRIGGFVTLYKGQPQIVISRPDQVEILDEMPATTDVSLAGASHAVGDQFVLATYNVLNLFDAEDDPYHADEGTAAKPRAELTHLAQSIEALDADVIAMQEVESRGYLQRFVDVFLPDLGYEHVVHFEGNDHRGIDVCLISRIPVGEVRSHRHLQFPGANGDKQSFNRDVIAITLQPPGKKPIEVWVVHLKSNSGGREEAEPIRLAEAAALRKLLDRRLKENSDVRIALLGDFNDVWESSTLKTIAGAGPAALWSAASEITGPLPDTYNRGEFHSMIDFILCSPAMAKQYVKGSFRVPPGATETTGSDHNPVAATFRLE
ncbi:endonuclease/exonuclease/phosphatase family protein, partial [Pirellulales bacterium]|nr:endonuclease/exonuclease/phosphatase family protein [Pirellulales bacterium]